MKFLRYSYKEKHIVPANEQKGVRTQSSDTHVYHCIPALCCRGAVDMVQAHTTKTLGIKGDASAFQVLVVILIALVTLFFLVYFTVFKVKGIAEYTDWKTSCTESVRAHTVAGLGDFSTRSQITCPVYELTVTSELGNEQGQEQAKEKIAKMMKDCWDIYGRGKYKLFDRETAYCSPCAVVSFDGKGKVEEFPRYLAETRVQGQKTSYADYLAGVEKSEFKNLINDPSVASKGGLSQELDAQKKYGIVFMYIRGNGPMKELADALKTKPPVVAGGLGAAGIGGTVAAVVFIAGTPVGWAVGIVSAAALVGGGIAYAIEYLQGQPDAWLAMISIVEWNENALTDMRCKEVPVGVSPP